MTKKQVKNNPLEIEKHIGNDFVFLFLQLIGYPDPEPGEIKLGDLVNHRFRKLPTKDIVELLLILQEDGILEIETIEEKNYSLVKVSKKTIDSIQSALDQYATRFINGELIPIRDEPYKFKKQRDIFMEKVEERIRDGSQKIMSFSDADFIQHGEKFCFFACILALEKQGEIKVEGMHNERLPQAQAHYHVPFKLRGMRTEKRKLKLHCFPKGLSGYFQIKKNSEPKEIGSKNSRHFLLLEFLVRRGIEEKISFDRAYKAIEHGIHYGASKYGDDKERAIVNAKKYLQKKGRIKPYQIKIDKKQRQVWIE